MSNTLSPFETANRRLDKLQSVVNAKRVKAQSAELAVESARVKQAATEARLLRDKEVFRIAVLRAERAGLVFRQAESDYKRAELAANQIIDGPQPNDTGL